jgi:hypothetical protein
MERGMKILIDSMMGAVAHAFNPNYLGGWDEEDGDSRPAWANSPWDPHIQNKQSKMNWRYGFASSNLSPTTHNKRF